MMNLPSFPHLTDKRIGRVYIKDGRRRMMTDSGTMLASAGLTRLMFGKARGGKYSARQ